MIRDMKLIDLDQMVLIEDASFKDGRYNKDQLLYEFKDNPLATTLVYEEDNLIKGFLIYMVTFNSATIIQIATDPKYRKNKIASSLLNEMIKRLSKKYGEIETVTLEVREINKAAHSFYLKNGFKDVLVKKRYYTNGDNAIYMMRVLL